MQFEAYIEDDLDILSDADLQAMQKNIQSQKDEIDIEIEPEMPVNETMKESSIKESKQRSTQNYSDDEFDHTDGDAKRDSVDSHIQDQIKHMDDITSFEDVLSSKRSAQIPVIPEEDTQDRLTTERTRLKARDAGIKHSEAKKEEMTNKQGGVDDEHPLTKTNTKEDQVKAAEPKSEMNDEIDDDYSQDQFDSKVADPDSDNGAGSESLFERDGSSSRSKEQAISANTFERASSRD